MIRTIEAFLWSLLIHLLILLLLVLSFREVALKTPPPQSKTPQKITLNLKQFTPPVPKPKPITPPAPAQPQSVPKQPEQQQAKKAPIKEQKTTKTIPIAADNNATKPTKKQPPKPVKKPVKKPLPKKVIKPKQMFQKVQPRPSAPKTRSPIC